MYLGEAGITETKMGAEAACVEASATMNDAAHARKRSDFMELSAATNHSRF
jgi:hypothetical protein